MSDISHIQLGSDGEVYDIKDASAVRGIKINGSDVTASDSVVDLTQYGGYYGVCSTAAATETKEVSCTGFQLFTGSIITVKFTITNTAAVANIKLNVNSTGGKNIKYRNANLSSAEVIAANRIYHFVYDGTYWQIIGDLDTDTKNTAGSTDTSSKIYLIGATSQAANPQTYSDNEVYTTSGALTTKTVSVGGGSCKLQYNTTTQSLDFVFT